MFHLIVPIGQNEVSGEFELKWPTTRMLWTNQANILIFFIVWKLLIVVWSEVRWKVQEWKHLSLKVRQPLNIGLLTEALSYEAYQRAFSTYCSLLSCLGLWVFEYCVVEYIVIRRLSWLADCSHTLIRVRPHLRNGNDSYSTLSYVFTYFQTSFKIAV